MKYVDAKGKEQRPVRCAKLRGGDDHIIGNGWYAVTGNISYASGMIVWGETNLILCDGAGISAGFYCNASKGKVVITGGRVMATGGNGGAGIGGGKEDVNSGGEGANVEIGGTADVTAWAGGTNEYALCSAIGRGHKDSNFGTLKLSDNMLVRAGRGFQSAEDSEPCAPDKREEACKNNWYAHVQPCDHPDSTFSDIDDKTHTVDACKYCLQGGRKEAHDFGVRTRRCRVCNYAQRVEITFDGNGAPGEMDRQKLAVAEGEALDVNSYTWKDHTFKEWNTKKDGSGKAYADGAVPEGRPEGEARRRPRPGADLHLRDQAGGRRQSDRRAGPRQGRADWPVPHPHRHAERGV